MNLFVVGLNLASAMSNAAVYVWGSGTWINLALVPVGLLVALFAWWSAS